MSYSIQEHRHRFAAWAASRAASVINCRFSAEDGKALLEYAGLDQLLGDPSKLPTPQCFDDAHRRWREAVIVAAKKRKLKPFSHGVAAKLINIYLKSVFVCGGHHDHPHVRAIHPPIDSVLLDELDESNVGERRHAWRKARRIRWSNLASSDYQDLIQNIREALHGEAFWEVEEYWQGYQ